MPASKQKLLRTAQPPALPARCGSGVIWLITPCSGLSVWLVWPWQR